MYRLETLTIAATETTSSVLDKGNAKFLAFYFGASAWDGATVTFLVGQDPGGTLVAPVDGSGAALDALTVTTGKWVTLTAEMQARLAAFRCLQVVSASAEDPARTIQVALAE